MQIFKEIVVKNFKLLAQYFADKIEINMKVVGQNKCNLAEVQSKKFENSVPCSCSFTDLRDYENIDCFVLICVKRMLFSKPPCLETGGK